MILQTEIAGGDGLHIACSGTLDGAQFLEYRKAQVALFPNLGHWYFGIVDLTEVQQVNIAPADFDGLIELDRGLARRMRPGFCGAIIARSEIAFGMSRMYQAYLDAIGWETRVFRERDPAEAWLRQQVRARFGVELPPFEIGSGAASGR